MICTRDGKTIEMERGIPRARARWSKTGIALCLGKNDVWNVGSGGE